MSLTVIAIEPDVVVFQELGQEMRLNRSSLEQRIANLKNEAPDYDLSVEYAALAELKSQEMP